MVTFLFLPGLQGNFRVSERKAEKIAADIRTAMANGTVIEVEVELGDDPTNQPTVTVNGGALAWFTIASAPERPPSRSANVAPAGRHARGSPPNTGSMITANIASMHAPKALSIIVLHSCPW